MASNPLTELRDALEGCIIQLEEEPWKVLFEKDPDYDRA
jgi:hypothetical protein